MKVRLGPGQVSYLLLASFSVLAALFLGWTSYADRINHSFYDFYFRQRGPRPMAGGIFLVAIDDATLAQYGALPLDRSLLAQGIRVIEQAQPRLLAVDILLPDVSTAPADQDLQTAMSGPLPLVLATALEARPGGRWLDPLPGFAEPAAAIGHVHADPDEDGVSRRVLLAKQSGRERHWALALECFRLLQGEAQEPITETEGDLEIPSRDGSPSVQRIPASRQDQRALLINYAGGDGTFPQVGFSSLLDDPTARSRLQGQIVLLGVTAQGSGDRLFTPFSAGIGMAGVEIHAHILDTLLSGNFLRPAGNLEIALAVLCIAGITAWTLFRFHGLGLLSGLLGIGLGVLLAPYGLFRMGLVWPGFSLLLAFAVPLVVCGSDQLRVARRRYSDSEARRRRSQQQFEMVAHEIRTPLTAIQGTSELLSRYRLDESKRDEMLRLLYEESQRLGKLVERFLSVERLSAGEMELRRAPVEVTSFLSSLLERIRPTAERKGIRLVCENNSTPLELEADPELLEFAVSNLLVNAVKYSPTGTSVTLAVERDGSQVLLQVSDNGPGMTAEETRRIFDRFYRTEAARFSEAPGFGLGLSIAREIALHHGGDLRVQSEPGAGSRFTLVLPSVVPASPSKRPVG